MILIKDKTQERELTFINPKDHKVAKYGVLMQNTLTKEITTLNVLDRGVGIYLKFQMNLSQYQDGEYLVMVFENPDDLQIEAYDVNNTREIIGTMICYLADDGALLTDDDFFITGDNETFKLKPIRTDLIRIGEYKRHSTTYRSEQAYIQYNK